MPTASTVLCSKLTRGRTSAEQTSSLTYLQRKKFEGNTQKGARSSPTPFSACGPQTQPEWKRKAKIVTRQRILIALLSSEGGRNQSNFYRNARRAEPPASPPRVINCAE
ncbi:hypothetical protein CDAR_59411 [Caerostris darwini]|uniref:Uncharacterized protein n=1 Tax=Caerostris darwini TaxID=1538125 RepID=A0AAV4X660_9ARAC|nr:hypothetical protein CDAR_59411 [Caerostris darwini]